MVVTKTLTEEDVVGFMQDLSNWGRWGDDDELGTLNYITPERRRAAAAEVTLGRCVSLAHDINTQQQPNNPQPAIHLMLHSPYAPVDFLGLPIHGVSTTHIDALAHMHWEGSAYNGRPLSDLSHLGALSNDIVAWRDGIVARGVLLDIAAARGVPWLEAGTWVHAEDLEAAEQFGNVRLESGDIPIVRTGHWARMETEGWETPDIAGPGSVRTGLAADCLPWLHERQAAAYGGDCVERYPSGFNRVLAPLHMIGLVAMGLPLVDNVSVEPLSTVCEQEKRYSFQLIIAPLRIPGGTGSPVNPIAIF
ncbi:hypothetical protein ASJ79_22990 [Mycobacterium sp. NAZ190054]|nr:hypothetical protein ASJ79_22990 [Mycobacterium sp. NAZ190054]